MKQYIKKQTKRTRGRVTTALNRQKNWLIDQVRKNLEFEEGKAVVYRKTFYDDIALIIKEFPNNELEIMLPNVKQTARRSIRDITRQLNLISAEFELGFQEADRYVTQATELLLSDYKGTINFTTKERIRKALVEGMENGESFQQIAKRIESSPMFSKSRAEMIAVREIGAAYEESKTEHIKAFAERSGLRVEKAWQTIGLGLPGVTPECEANERAGWMDILDIFPSGDHEAPRDSNPRCRCATINRIE